MEISDRTSQPRPRRQKTKSYTDQEWDNIKPHFCELYVTKGWTLKQTKWVMAERHQFFASYEESLDLEVHLPELTTGNSDKMYKTRIKRWNLRKYNQDRESLHVIRKANEAAEKGNSVIFRVNGRIVTPDEAKKHFVRKGFDYEQALAHRRLGSPTPSAVEVADQSQNETPESDESDDPRDLDIVANHALLDLVSLDTIQKPVNSSKPPLAWPDPIVDWSTLDLSSWLDPYIGGAGEMEGLPRTPPKIPYTSVYESPRRERAAATSAFEDARQRRDEDEHQQRDRACQSIQFQFAEPVWSNDQDRRIRPRVPELKFTDARCSLSRADKSGRSSIDETLNSLTGMMARKLRIVDAVARH